MKSYEILKEAIDQVGAKSVASDLKVSQPLIYKWCASSQSQTNEEASGTLNPLDRVKAICTSTESTLPVQWLCEQLQGYFVKNPSLPDKNINQDYLIYTQKILQEFTNLLQSISDSMADDSKIDQDEAALIRSKWEDLKSHGEEFVTSCEQGRFNKQEENKERL